MTRFINDLIEGGAYRDLVGRRFKVLRAGSCANLDEYEYEYILLNIDVEEDITKVIRYTLDISRKIPVVLHSGCETVKDCVILDIYYRIFKDFFELEVLEAIPTQKISKYNVCISSRDVIVTKEIDML